MLDLLTDAVLGGLLGLFYFGGLWLTVRNLEQLRRPVLVTLGSFLVRSIVVGGFYLMLDDGWQGVALGLVGFLIARMILVRVWGPAPRSPEKTAA